MCVWCQGGSGRICETWNRPTKKKTENKLVGDHFPTHQGLLPLWGPGHTFWVYWVSSALACTNRSELLWWQTYAWPGHICRVAESMHAVQEEVSKRDRTLYRQVPSPRMASSVACKELCWLSWGWRYQQQGIEQSWTLSAWDHSGGLLHAFPGCWAALSTHEYIYTPGPIVTVSHKHKVLCFWLGGYETTIGDRFLWGESLRESGKTCAPIPCSWPGQVLRPWLTLYL